MKPFTKDIADLTFDRVSADKVSTELMERLVWDITYAGVKRPIKVTKHGTVREGRYRLEAAILAGRTTVPVVIVE